MSKKNYASEESREDRIVRARNHHVSRREKKESAIERQLAYTKLNVLERLENLNNRLGEDIGAVKERKKFLRVLAEILSLPLRGK